MHWWTIPTVRVVTFAFFGIGAIGLEIENPFGYDANDKIRTKPQTMKFIDLVLQWSIYLSVVINAIVVYLNINKMWSRKQEPVVADSISVAAQLISFITIIPFLISYTLKGNYGDALYQFL